MKNELDRKSLYNEAFALIEKIQAILLDARAKHEKDASLIKKAA